MPGQARVPAENPPEENPPAEEQAAAAGPPAVRGPREEQEHQEGRSRRLEELQEQHSRLLEAAKEREEKDNRNLLDRTRRWHAKLAELENQLAGARRRGQDWLAAALVEELAGLPARAAEAG